MPDKQFNIINESDKKTPKVSPLQATYAAIFSSQAGQLVLEDILMYSGVVSINNPGDATTMAFNEGRRAIGLYILKQIGHITWDTLQGASRKKK